MPSRLAKRGHPNLSKPSPSTLRTASRVAPETGPPYRDTRRLVQDAIAEPVPSELDECSHAVGDFTHVKYAAVE